MVDFLSGKMFQNRDMCYIVAFLKFASTFLAELAMIYVICSEDEVQDVIKDFICLGFILELDNLFASTSISPDKLQTVVESELIIDQEDDENLIQNLQ